jgi:hypothetical protein
LILLLLSYRCMHAFSMCTLPARMHIYNPCFYAKRLFAHAHMCPQGPFDCSPRASYMLTVTACLNMVGRDVWWIRANSSHADHGTHSPSITIPIIPTTSPFPALNIIWRPKLALDRWRRLPGRDLTFSRRTVCKQAALERRRRRGLRW